MTAATVSCAFACAGDLEAPERFSPPACLIRAFDASRDVFAARCGECHVGPSPEGGLDLARPGVIERLSDAPSGCGGALLVDTSSVAGSYLLEKLGPSPRCGSSMPLGSPPLSPETRGCLRAWAFEISGQPGGGG